MSQRSGLALGVGAANRYAKQISKRVSADTSIFVTAAIEHILSDVIKDANAEAQRARRQRITHDDILSCVRRDKELDGVFGNLCIYIADVCKAKGPKSSR